MPSSLPIEEKLIFSKEVLNNIFFSHYNTHTSHFCMNFYISYITEIFLCTKHKVSSGMKSIHTTALRLSCLFDEKQASKRTTAESDPLMNKSTPQLLCASVCRILRAEVKST